MNQFPHSTRYRATLEIELRQLRRRASLLRGVGAPIAGVLVVLGVPFMLTGWLSGKCLDLLQAAAGRTSHPLLRAARIADDQANSLIQPVAIGSDLMGSDWDQQGHDDQAPYEQADEYDQQADRT
jgi:hypothetical protein